MYLTWCPNIFTDFNTKSFISKEMKTYCYITLVITAAIDIFWLIFYKNQSKNFHGADSIMFSISYVLSIILFV